MKVTAIEAPVSMVAALLLNRFTLIALHHIGALREALGEKSDAELSEIVLTGKMEVSE